MFKISQRFSSLGVVATFVKAIVECYIIKPIVKQCKMHKLSNSYALLHKIFETFYFAVQKEFFAM